MILESIFSCSCLSIVCGSSIYTIASESWYRYGVILPHFSLAFLGITIVGARSLIHLIYKLFLKTYTFDPFLIEKEEERNKSRVNILDQILDTVSKATLIYSLFCHHAYYILGATIVSVVSFADLYTLRRRFLAQFHVESYDLENPYWVLFSGCFSYHVRNNYGLVANYPYLITTWALPPEGFYQAWTVKRAINDYMMAVYIILMTEALRFNV